MFLKSLFGLFSAIKKSEKRKAPALPAAPADSFFAPIINSEKPEHHGVGDRLQAGYRRLKRFRMRNEMRARTIKIQRGW